MANTRHQVVIDPRELIKAGDRFTAAIQEVREAWAALPAGLRARFDGGRTSLGLENNLTAFP